ncbi:unnamed protein product [Rhizophagus irregularis]|nr:unnamed protein product [Rhizophagus irregularis]
MEKKPKKLWKSVYYDEHQDHVTISTIDSTTESEVVDERIVYMDDLEKRKQVYGICGECNEPGTGEAWCQPYFLNEIKTHLNIHLNDVIECNGITQDPNTKADDSDDGDDGEDSEDSEYDEDSEDSEDSEDDDEDDEDVNSSDLSSFQFNSDTNYTIQSTLANPSKYFF